MDARLLQWRADLIAAQASRSLVRVRRSLEPGWANGYVVNVGPHLFALLLVSDLIIFNGFQVFRIRDLSSVEVPAPHASFVETALRLRDAPAPPPPPIDLTDFPSLLRSASAAFPIVTVHREIENPGACQIGAVQRVVDGTVTLKAINPDAEWDDEPEMLALSEITRVDFGGLYEQALGLVSEAAQQALEADRRTSS